MIAHEGFGRRHPQGAHGEPHREAVCGRASFRLVVAAVRHSTGLRWTRAAWRRAACGGRDARAHEPLSRWPRRKRRVARLRATHPFADMVLELPIVDQTETTVVARSFVSLKQCRKVELESGLSGTCCVERSVASLHVFPFVQTEKPNIGFRALKSR